MTTPTAVELQSAFGELRDQGIELVAIEASSIGLEQGRLAGTHVAVAALTNVTRDHLDYHGSMQAYEAAKGSLFDWPGLRAAVLPVDDAAGARLLARIPDPVRRIGYMLRDSLDATATLAQLRNADARLARCDCVIVGASHGESGSLHLLRLRADRTEQVCVALQTVGRFNRLNALLVAAVWSALDWSIEDIARALRGLRPVPGRMQMVGEAADCSQPLVVVDYAHTPDALRNVLLALRPLASERGGQLWCVFGAGGDRDSGKRGPMAAAAEAGADRIVLTSDNPRSEDPQSILAQLGAGLHKTPEIVDPDRGQAIVLAIGRAQPRDVVLVAGKGHEDCQEIDGRRVPFSDLEESRSALLQRQATQSTQLQERAS